MEHEPHNAHLANGHSQIGTELQDYAARQHSVPCTLGCMLDYGRWPKGNGTKPMSWGVAQGCDEYRRWRINHEGGKGGGGKGAWHLMSGNKTLFQRKLRRRIRAFARLEVLDLMGRLKSGGHRLFNRGIRFTDHTSHAIPVPNPCSSVVKTQRHISTSSSSLPPFRVFPVFRG